MIKNLVFSLLVLFVCSCLYGNEDRQNGFFDFTYSEDEGTVILEIQDRFINQEFLYVNSLSAGIGSNDIGLDRGQLGSDRLVRIEKMGNKLMLVQLNTRYRANSNNKLERQAIEEAFAQSILAGWKIESHDKGIYKVDITEFLLRDAHGVADRLKRGKEGNYSLDKSRSAVNTSRTKSFPDNTEFDAILTFGGEPDGVYLRSVTPDAKSVTVQQHHSFIRLQDAGYQPRVFHSYSGFNNLTYADYATPIESPLEKKYITRHRLEKKNPSANISAAKEPIIYYMDPGCPEPIKSALMEGAAWWDQAFQAAGFASGTFQVRELPDGVDMMDVRYNVIQWVHRSTRGWSYGSSIIDPRTGEILKGHVSLGSLRVRQDFLIAQGLLSPYGGDDNNNPQMKELALARLRQLAAHEVGHTIGLAHNFAASTNDRSSVMDYPHPYVELDVNGNLDFSQMYDDKIGAWDKHTISYGYRQYKNTSEEKNGLLKQIESVQKAGLRYISDRDARPQGGAQPHGHLWDNRPDPSVELNRMLKVRKNALKRFGEDAITSGTPVSELEKVLVPLYLMHRYQVEAVTKLIGGLEYSYGVKGDALNHKVSPVGLGEQDKAIQAILNSLSAQELKLPDHVISLLPPPAKGYSRSRESFRGRTNLAFDVLGPVESYATTVFSLMLHPDRLARIHRHNVAHGHAMSLALYLDQLSNYIFEQASQDLYGSAIEKVVQHNFVMHLLEKATNKKVDPLTGSIAHGAIQRLKSKFLSKEDDQSKRLAYLINHALLHPETIKLPTAKALPPGSPIGCGIGL